MKPFHVSRIALACVVGVVASGGGCVFAAPAEAPEGLEDLSRFIWDRFERPADPDAAALQDIELREAAKNLDKALKDVDVVADKPDNVLKNTLQDIEKERVENLEGVAPRLDQLGLAQGLVTANTVACTLAQNQNLTLSEKSVEIHPDVYAEYEKEFDTPVDEFASGDVDQIFWRLHYKIGNPPVGSPYTADTRAGARRVTPADEPAEGDVGEIFITRVHLPEPAVFDGDGSEFTLDFQLETYWENEEGTLTHFYAMWRRMKLGPIDSQQEVFINTSLDGMIDWDKETAVACADGRADSRD